MELMRRFPARTQLDLLPVLRQLTPTVQPKRRLRSVIVAVSSRPLSPGRPGRPAGLSDDEAWFVEPDRDSAGLESRRYDSSEDDGRGGSSRRFNERAEMFRVGCGIPRHRQRKGRDNGSCGRRRQGRRSGRKRNKRPSRARARRAASPAGPPPGSEHRLQLDDEASRFKDQLRVEKELMLARALASLAQDGTSAPCFTPGSY